MLRGMRSTIKYLNLLSFIDYGVGKSSLVMRYTDDTFTEGCVVTIGAKFVS